MDMSWEANHHEFERSENNPESRLCVVCGHDDRHPWHGNRPIERVPMKRLTDGESLDQHEQQDAQYDREVH